MILVSNPPQNENSELFFWGLFGNSSYYYKSNSPCTPKKGPNHSQLGTYYGGEKDRFLFFSICLLSRFKPILLKILGCQPSKLGGPAPTRLYLVSPSPSYPSFSLGKKRKRKKSPHPLLDRRKKEEKKMILIFYLFK